MTIFAILYVVIALTTSSLDTSVKIQAPPGEIAASYANAQIGKPWVRGASGPGAFDCSGLTSTAWLVAGVVIPRTSHDQLRLPQVPRDAIIPGDILAQPGHVGIYVGAGNVVHASSTVVKSVPLSNSYWDLFTVHRPG